MIKGTIYQENITYINKYASNIGAPKDLKQLLTDLKEENDNTIIVGDSSLHLDPWIDHPESKQGNSGLK